MESSEHTQLPRDCLLGLYPPGIFLVSACLESGCTRPTYECVFKTKPIRKSKPTPDPEHCPQWEQGKKHPQYKPHLCQICSTTDETLFYPGVKNHCKQCLQAIRAEKRGRKPGETVTRICRQCGETFQKVPSAHNILCEPCRDYSRNGRKTEST